MNTRPLILLLTLTSLPMAAAAHTFSVIDHWTETYKTYNPTADVWDDYYGQSTDAATALRSRLQTATFAGAMYGEYASQSDSFQATVHNKWKIKWTPANETDIPGTDSYSVVLQRRDRTFAAAYVSADAAGETASASGQAATWQSSSAKYESLWQSGHGQQGPVGDPSVPTGYDVTNLSWVNCDNVTAGVVFSWDSTLGAYVGVCEYIDASISSEGSAVADCTGNDYAGQAEGDAWTGTDREVHVTSIGGQTIDSSW